MLWYACKFPTKGVVMQWQVVLAAVVSQRHPSPQHTIVAGALRTAQAESEKSETVVIGTQGEELQEVNRTRPLCAIGDMHGDPDHALSALRLCGAVGEDGRWSGGTMTVVQLGDVFDRGNASVALQQMGAARAGGRRGW